MSVQKKTFYLICFLMVCFQFAMADSVYLKNGNKIEGVILSETENDITINIGHGATVVQRKDFVDKVERVERAETKNENNDLDLGQPDGQPDEKLSVSQIFRLAINSINLDQKNEFMMYLSKLDPETLMSQGKKGFMLVGLILNGVYLGVLMLILVIMCAVNKELPLGIKIARAISFFNITVMLGVFAAFTLFFVFNIMLLSSSGIILPLGVVLILQIFSIYISYWVFSNLAKYKPAARKVQIFFSIFGLLNFPTNTILNAIILYSLFKKENKALFPQAT